VVALLFSGGAVGGSGWLSVAEAELGRRRFPWEREKWKKWIGRDGRN
jgi:hypothetical protein